MIEEPTLADARYWAIQNGYLGVETCFDIYPKDEEDPCYCIKDRDHKDKHSCKHGAVWETED